MTKKNEIWLVNKINVNKQREQNKNQNRPIAERERVFLIQQLFVKIFIKRAFFFIIILFKKKKKKK